MVSNHSVREIEPWYEEGKVTIKENLEPHFDNSSRLSFHLRIQMFA